MPLRDFCCLACGEVQERFFHAGSVPACACGGVLEMQPLSAGTNRKTPVFPFDVQVDGRTVRVDDIGGLRAMERQYGVMATAFSQDPSNPDSPTELPESRPGGHAYEGLRLRDYVAQRRADGRRAFIRALETGRYR